MSVLTISVPGELRGKGRPRFSRASGRTYTPAATANAETWIRACAIEQVGQPVIEGPVDLRIYAYIPPPQSWSKKKRAAALAWEFNPTGRPDCDNCIKLVADSLNQVVWRDDSQIWRVCMTKRFAETALTVLEVEADVVRHLGLAARATE